MGAVLAHALRELDRGGLLAGGRDRQRPSAGMRYWHACMADVNAGAGCLARATGIWIAALVCGSGKLGTPCVRMQVANSRPVGWSLAAGACGLLEELQAASTSAQPTAASTSAQPTAASGSARRGWVVGVGGIVCIAPCCRPAAVTWP